MRKGPPFLPRVAAWAFLLLLPLGGAAAAAPAGESPPGPLALSGRLGIAWADPPDSLVPPEEPSAWSWSSIGAAGIDRPLPRREGVAWGRLDFQLDRADLFGEPVLLFPRPADAMEVFLNGEQIGGEGSVSKRFVTAPQGPLLLGVPAGALRAGANRLSLRLLFSGKNTHVFEAPLWLGEEDDLAVRENQSRRLTLGVEAAYLGLFSFITVFYGFVISHRIPRGEYVFFFLFSGLYGVAFLLGSNWFSLLGNPSPFITQLRAVLSAFLVMVMISLVTSATGSRFNLVFFALLLLAGVFTLAEAIVPPLQALVRFGPAKKVFLGGLGLYYLWLAGRAVLARHPESKLVFLGVAAYVAGSRLEWFWGIDLQDLSICVFALFMLSALVLRGSRSRERLEEVSGRLLDAHEEERRRIARDLHDGIGQELLALRLQLQILAAKALAGEPPAPAALEEQAGRVQGLVEEVRRTALDLRLSHVEDRGLLEALRWYGADFSARHGVEVVVHQPPGPVPDPPRRVKDNLFRVFQEALNNVGRHARAGRVDVFLYRSGGRMVLQVADDGAGFDLARKGRSGMGLSTMTERAELLEGTFKVETREGRGTMVTMEVPVR